MSARQKLAVYGDKCSGNKAQLVGSKLGNCPVEERVMTEGGFNKERLCSLIRLLSTPVDGERLGAVCGIDRILKAAGLTFHDLASAVAVSRLVVDEDGCGANYQWLDAGREMLETEELSAKEREFVEDMCRRFTSPTFVPSGKQINWFVMIYRRAVKDRVAA
jgi:hypothetical protein